MRTFPAVCLLAVAFAAISCKDDTPEMPTPVEGVEIVTYLGQDDEGSRWEMQRVTDSSPVPLVTSQVLKGESLPEKGRRMLAYYSAALADTALRPMPVKLLQVATIPFDTIKSATMEEIRKKGDAQMNVLSSWTTGDYLNFQVTLDYDGTARSFSLLADEATLGNDEVECYLVRKGAEVTENFVERRTYGSFYTGKILTRENQKIRIKQLKNQ